MNEWLSRILGDDSNEVVVCLMGLIQHTCTAPQRSPNRMITPRSQKSHIGCFGRITSRNDLVSYPTYLRRDAYLSYPVIEPADRI